MGMTVRAIAGMGIITSVGPDDFTYIDEDYESPDWLIWTAVGAYAIPQLYFLGSGASVGWNAEVTGVPITLPDIEEVRKVIQTELRNAKLDSGKTAESEFTEAGFGFHVYPYVD